MRRMRGLREVADRVFPRVIAQRAEHPPAAAQLATEELVGDRLAAEAVAPALDVSDRGRREMHRAAQCARVAVTLEKAAPRRGRLGRIIIDPHHEIRIARLQRRVDQIAGKHRLIAAAPGADGEVIGSMSGGRAQPDVHPGRR